MRSFIYFCLFLAVTVSPTFAEDAQVQELEQYVQSLRTVRNDVVDSYNHFEKTLHEKNVPAATTQLQELQQLVNASIRQLESMNGYRQEAEYRTSVLSFMQYMQSVTNGSLIDIVHRRLMLGLDADQGRGMYVEIAAIAARECGWDAEKESAELAALTAYSDSFRL